MTIFGVDLSSNNVDAKGNRVSLADCQAQGYDFVTARCIQEGKVKDPEYDGFHADAKAAGLLFAAYVFPWTGVPVTDTAHAAAAAIGEFDIPIMIDWENDGSSVPSYQFAKDLYDALRAAHLRPWSLYTFEPYWAARGSHPLTDRGWRLIKASFGLNPRVHGASAYPGDGSPRWDGFGGRTVSILQFGSRIVIDGFPGNIDGNAYRGTLPELRAEGLFKDYGTALIPAPTPIRRKGTGPMFLIAPDKATVPKGTAWPGVFTWNGSTLTHVTSPADEAALIAGGVVQNKTAVIVSYAQWLKMAGH